MCTAGPNTATYHPQPSQTHFNSASPLSIPAKPFDHPIVNYATPIPQALRRSPRFQRRSTFTREQNNIDARSVSQNNYPQNSMQNVARVLPLLEPGDTSAGQISTQPPLNGTACELGALIVEDSCEPDLMCKVYTFLHSLNKQKLRAVCKRLRCRMAGNKRELLFRAYLFLSHVHERDGDVIAFMSSRNEFEGTQKFFEDNELATLNLQSVPTKSYMVEHLKAAGDKLDDIEKQVAQNEKRSGSGAGTDPNFTHSEFARLVVIMRDDERAKEAMFALSQELQRPVLDAGLRRDNYWDLIATRFNDVNVKARFDFSGSLDDVNSSDPPLCHRSAATLKNQFQKARADFTKPYVNWKSSGQNAPDRFTEFLSYNQGELYSSSKRAYILFLCCQLGTPHANTLLLDSVTKSIAHGGLEEGLSMPSETPAEEVNGPSSRGQKRRRKSSNNILEDIQDASRSIIEASSAVTKRFQPTSNKAVSTMSLTQDTSALHLLSVKSKCYSELQSAYDNLQSARERGDPDLIGFAQASFDEAKKVCEGVRNEKQRSDSA